MSTFDKVKEIIVDTLNFSADDVQPESDLFKDLGADSLDAVELNMALEEEYGITIPDEEMPNLTTLEKIVKYIDEHAE